MTKLQVHPYRSVSWLSAHQGMDFTTKSEISRISQTILDRINSKISRASKFNQWKNTASVIEWFKAIKNKQHYSFICFDIEEFYSSISQDLLKRALDFASAYGNITDDKRNIITHTKHSILMHKQQPWQKKGDNTLQYLTCFVST